MQGIYETIKKGPVRGHRSTKYRQRRRHVLEQIQPNRVCALYRAVGEDWRLRPLRPLFEMVKYVSYAKASLAARVK